MLLCYVQMGRVLWGHQAIGEENISTRKSRKTKQKVCDLHLIHRALMLLSDREDVRPDGGCFRSVLAALPLLLPLLLPQPEHHEGQPHTSPPLLSALCCRPGTHLTCISPSTGWQCPPAVSILSSTTPWTKGKHLDNWMWLKSGSGQVSTTADYVMK